MSTQHSEKQKIVSQEIPDSQKKYRYVCNCKKCIGKEITAKTQVKHAKNKEYWNSQKLRKRQLKEIEARNSRYVVVREAVEKKRKRDSKQSVPSEETKVPKLKKDISVSDMLTELNLASNTFDNESEEEVIASSSKSRYDQFHNPLQDEIPDIVDDNDLYDIGGEELIDDLKEVSNDDIDEHEDIEYSDNTDDDYKDVDSFTDNNDDDKNIDIGNEDLFTMSEIENKKYKYIDIRYLIFPLKLK